MKIGILYVAIGRYWEFWSEFYASCELYFLPDLEKEYFVFTDKEIIERPANVFFFFQEDMGWPGNTLFRFKMFYEKRQFYLNCEYLYFFNANSLFVETICSEEFIPSSEDNYLLSLSWDLYKKKNKEEYPYERNTSSKAYISYDKGSSYYQGGINGGRRKEYLLLIKCCRDWIDIDNSNNLIAIHHDESHLNKYLLDFNIKVLGTIYGRPEEWTIPQTPKIIFRDKNALLGNGYMNSFKERHSRSFRDWIIHVLVMCNKLWAKK